MPDDKDPKILPASFCSFLYQTTFRALVAAKFMPKLEKNGEGRSRATEAHHRIASYLRNGRTARRQLIWESVEVMNWIMTVS